MAWLPQGSREQNNYPPLDIVVAVPGLPSAPVADATLYPPGSVITTPPAGWAAANLNGAYYEIRGRSLRLEQVVGQTGFAPRTRLGFHLSIAPWADGVVESVGADYGGLIPSIILSNSLSQVGINSLTLGSGAALVDPAYGPVIRINNDVLLHPGDRITPLWIVNLQIQETKDEDFTGSGHY
jgi:hypothetical protein